MAQSGAWRVIYTAALAILLAYVHRGTCQQTASIIQDPESWNTTLGAYVSFYCLIMGDEANWEINGIKDVNVPALAGLSPYVIVTRASIPGALYTELRLTANSTNEVKIRCVSTYHSGSTAFSQTATMQVQGLLYAPTEITVNVTQNSSSRQLTITWTAPPTLDITGLDPDITYRVCNNVTDECVSTSDTSYAIPTTCVPVEYSVRAHNPVGYGPEAVITYSGGLPGGLLDGEGCGTNSNNVPQETTTPPTSSGSVPEDEEDNTDLLLILGPIISGCLVAGVLVSILVLVCVLYRHYQRAPHKGDGGELAVDILPMNQSEAQLEEAFIQAHSKDVE